MQEFGLSFIWTAGLEPDHERLRRAAFIYGTRRHVVHRAAARDAALDRDRAVPDRDRAAAARRADRDDGRAARGDPECRARPLGHPRLRALGRETTSSPGSQSWLGFLPIFSGDPSQAGMLPAALVLTIMIIPITSAICRELFSRVPRDLTDGSLALGSTRWEAIRGVMFPYAAPGHLGRRPARPRPRVRRGDRRHAGDRRRQLDQPTSLFAPGDTLGEPDRLAVPGGELEPRGAVAPLPRRDPDGDLARHERGRAVDREQVPEGSGGVDRMSADEHHRPVRHHRALERPRPPAADARSSFGARRPLSALFAVVILALVLGTVLFKGLSAAQPRLLHQVRGRSSARRAASPTRWSAASSSSGMAMVMAVPLAILVAIYISEYAGPKARVVLPRRARRAQRRPRDHRRHLHLRPARRRARPERRSTARSRSRSSCSRWSRARRRRCSSSSRASLREASLALGVTRWRTICSIVLPTAIGGILTGVVIAVARVAGETAPLLFTSSIAANQVSFDVRSALPTLPVAIFTLSESPVAGRPGGGVGGSARADRIRARA